MKRYKILCLIIFVLALLLTGCDENNLFGKSTSDYISIVRNGYLGEYTDITVKDMLAGHYSLIYDKETWDGGTTDSGKEIVEVKYQDSTEMWEDTIIQFTMLDDQCFQITAFVDPMETIEQSTDLLATLNYYYFEQYTLKHQEIVGNYDAEFEFIQRLEQISGSSVLYGASVDYTGNRAELCKLVNESELGITVPWLLDSYGFLDMSYYSTDITINEPSYSPYPTDDNTTTTNDYIAPTPDIADYNIYEINPSDSDIIVETDYYSITIPASWGGRCIYKQQGNELTFYESYNYNNGYGGKLFRISLQTDKDFFDYPGFTYIGALVEAPHDGMKPMFVCYVAVSTPTDVQFSDDGADTYIEMKNDITAILSSFVVKDGYALLDD